MTNTQKDYYRSNGCYMEQQYEAGYRCEMRDPSNVQIPKILKYGDKGVPPLLPQLFAKTSAAAKPEKPLLRKIKTSTQKDNYRSDDCYMEQRFEEGYRCDMRDPSNVQIPRILEHGDKGVPSLLAHLFRETPPAEQAKKPS